MPYEQEKRMQEKLLHTDKLVALGTLTASVAHEVNTPNQAIMMSARTMSNVWDSIFPIRNNFAAASVSGNTRTG